MSPVPDSENAPAKEQVVKPVKAPKEEELSEEDQLLKEELDSLVEKIKVPVAEASSSFIDDLSRLKTLIKESTASLTAVPKPLKFLRPHFSDLTALYGEWEANLNDQPAVDALADIISVLAMTYSDDGKYESLRYRLRSQSHALEDWGHEYLRHLAMEIGEGFLSFPDDEAQILQLSRRIASFFMKNHAEADAVDLLLEVEAVDALPGLVDKSNYARVCQYMIGCVPFLAPPDNMIFLDSAYQIYMAQDDLAPALTLALKIDDIALIEGVFEKATNPLTQQQLAFILSQHYSGFKLENALADIQDIISNAKLPQYYSYLVNELNLLDPKVPEDIYKLHLENTKFGLGTSGLIDSAKQNLAAAFVNAFINYGFGSDKLVQTEQDNKLWIYKTKGPGIVLTTASLAAIHMWNVDKGLEVLDKYTYLTENEVKAGALLGMGIVTANVHSDMDASLALLQEYVDNPDKLLQSLAMLAFGIAFAGTNNEEVMNLLLPLVADTDLPIEISCLAILALGHVFVGTANGEITQAIMQTAMERSQAQLMDKFAKFIALGLGLLYMGKADDAEDVLSAIDAIEFISSEMKVLVTICANAGTGNVLQIQRLLALVSARPKQDTTSQEKKLELSELDVQAAKSQRKAERAAERGLGVSEDIDMLASGNQESATVASRNEADGSAVATQLEELAAEGDEDEEESDSDEDEDDESETLAQGISVLGVAVIAMGEDIGLDMSLRHFSHFMHYGNATVRKAVPLAMGLVSASNPQMKVFDTLSRYSHDPDLEVAQNAIYAMGLVGAGTNNARLAQLLRQLASYYIKLPDTLFMVRVAQGMLHLGKGTLTVLPFNSERTVLSKVSLALLLTLSIALLNPKDFILSDATSHTTHQLLYYLTPAIKPRMLVTVDEQLQPIKVNVRVGQAVDVVGQAGKPKTITGWVTQLTPVLLNFGERAELENMDEWITTSNALEGVVILKKNPDYVEVDV